MTKQIIFVLMTISQGYITERSETMDNFQISLAAARVNARLTQEDISKELNVSKNTVVNWENGKSEPTISQARRLAQYCGVPLDRIIFLPTKTN